MTGIATAGMWAPLRIANFRWLACGRAMVYFSNALTPIVLGFAVLDLGGSVVAVGFVVGARSVANVCLLLLGGVLADRLPRPVLLQGAGAVAAVVQGAAAASLFTGWGSIPLLAVLSVVNGVAAAVSVPTAAALTPQTVPPEMLRQANAVARIAINIGLLLGASMGGVIAAIFGSAWGLVATGLAFGLCSLAFAGVRLPYSVKVASEGSMIHQLRIGWVEFVSRSWVWIVVLQFMLVNAAIAGGVQVLGLTVATETIGRQSWGLVLGAQTIGAFVGGLVAMRWRPRHQLQVGVGLVMFAALPLVTLAYAPRLDVLLLVMFLNGMALEQFAIAWDVSLQEHIPPDRLARVYSYDALGSFLAVPLGEMAVGPLTLAAGKGTVLLALGATVVLVSGFVCLLPSIRAVVSGVDTPAGVTPDPVDAKPA